MRSESLVSSLVLAGLLALLPAAVPPAAAQSGAPAEGTEAAEEGPEPRFAPETLQAMEYRLIGPFRGGRVTAVAGVLQDPRVFYMGSTGGGVWKTTDVGQTWVNVSDGFFEAGSIGAVAVAPSDPNVVWAGTGSACIRGNVSPGVGVYRSTDAGATWEHVGLPEAGQIGRLHVHPNDPDTAWVAALGHVFGPNPERGVYKTTDGGETWERTLFVSERAGAVDLALDPTNPRILYASTWEVVRQPWQLVSGGPGSALWKSTDGGESWEELTNGLPDGILGRIGVAVSPARPSRVWALVEAVDGGLFRSEDGGGSFRLINDDRELRQRAWYYTHVHAHPTDPETVFVLNAPFFRSVDGGKSFSVMRTPHGDNHDLWIHPDHPEIWVEGNDGGANVTLNDGASWSTQTNQPTAEFYRVSVSEGFPYRVYGAQQDNSTVSLPSRTEDGAIDREHWWAVGGGESGHIVVDPEDEDVVYAGSYGGTITRYDHETGRSQNIMTYPQLALGQAPKTLAYRFQWNAPIRISPHDPDVLYHASQVVHRSRDEGRSWEVISPDLTRDDESKQDYSGGPVTWDNTGVEVYGTIFAFEESPHHAGVLWAGSDDGLVHLSRDDGETWRNVTPGGMPEWATVNSIDVSSHAPGRAFLAVQRYRLDDFSPYVFRTDDHGATWSLLTDGENGIPDDHFVRVVREDPDRKGLLYAGTEFGLYVSFDDGARWQPLQLNLPVSPITDLQVQDRDLVVATQGRSFWILDDLTPLHQLTDEIAAADVHLFDPRDTVRFPGGGFFRPQGSVGANPPSGVIFHYLLSDAVAPPADEEGEDTETEAEEAEPATIAGEEPRGTDLPTEETRLAAEPPVRHEGEEVVLEIFRGATAEGDPIRRFSSHTPQYQAPSPFRRFFPFLAQPKVLPAKEGMNRFVWDLTHPDARIVDDAVLWGSAGGPEVAPGTFTARLTVGDEVREQSFDVLVDPRLDVTREDLVAQEELALDVWRGLERTHDAIRTIRAVREQVTGLPGRLGAAGTEDEELASAADELAERLTALERGLHQTKTRSSQDPLNYPPMLDGQLVYLLGVVTGTEGRPTDGAYQRWQDLSAELDSRLAELDRLLAEDVAAFNERAGALVEVPVLVPVGEGDG